MAVGVTRVCGSRSIRMLVHIWVDRGEGMNEWMVALINLLCFPLLFSLGPRRVPLILKVDLPPQLNLSRNTFTDSHLRVCLLGDSKSTQFVNE